MKMNRIDVLYRILLTTIFFVMAFSATGRAADAEFPLREIFSNAHAETDEAYYFFVPQRKNDKNRYTYMYDTKLDRLLLLPGNEDLVSKIDGQEMEPEDWARFLNELILNRSPGADVARSQDLFRLKVIEIDEDWVKFTLGKRHIVLPLKLMVEGWGQKNFPLGKEIVDRYTSLPEDYAPDDLAKIHQKWNFHTLDYPKYLRKHVVHMIERMLQNAEDQGINIRVFSAFRSYEKQRYLYLNAVSRFGKDQNQVAKQGHSEHQLGTAVDLCGMDPKTVLNSDFDQTREGRWLRENATKFGFHQSYTYENQHLTGYIPEPWHYRFLREPL